MAKQSWLQPTMPLLIAMFLAIGTARAEFQMIEDFEDLIPGPIDEQNGWVAADTSSAVVVFPTGGDNQVLSVITESTHLHKATLLPEGETRMLFFRFRFGSQLSCSFGMSDLVNPSRFDHFEVELSLTNSTGELRIKDGGTFDVIAMVESDTWYNTWLLIDNTTNEIQIWMHDRGSQPATAADQLEMEGQTVFTFRNGGTNDLQTFYIKTGGGSGVVGPLLIDDIYLEETNALNLSYPGEAVSAVIPEDHAPLHLELVPGEQTAVHFTLSQASDIDLAVYDAHGRRVAGLLSGYREPNAYEVRWGGRDAHGQAVPNGIYFWRLSAAEGVRTSRMMLAR